MSEADDLTAKDIRRWYHKHGLPYEEEDWGPRSDTGESAGQQTQHQERTGRDGVRSSATTPDRMWWWETKALPWSARSRAEQEWVNMLDDFFSPYIAMLPRPKGNLLTHIFAEQLSYAETAKAEGLSSKGSIHKQVQRAVHDLTRLIAEDDALFHPPADGRARDFDDEQRAARRVFVLYLAGR